MSQVILESAVIHSGPVMHFPKIWSGFCTGEGTVDGMTALKWVDGFALPPTLRGATCFSCSCITAVLVQTLQSFMALYGGAKSSPPRSEVSWDPVANPTKGEMIPCDAPRDICVLCRAGASASTRSLAANWRGS